MNEIKLLSGSNSETQKQIELRKMPSVTAVFNELNTEHHEHRMHKASSWDRSTIIRWVDETCLVISGWTRW